VTAIPRPELQLESAALPEICALAGVTPTGAVLLHHRSNAVYRLPEAGVVARLAPDTPLRRDRACTSIAVCRWLAERAPGLALPPTPGDQPVVAAGVVATLWPFHDTGGQRPGPEVVGQLLRRLHALEPPPFAVPEFRPLHRLTEALTMDDDRAAPALSADDRVWLRRRVDDVVTEFTATEFPLGRGVVHGDAHDENLVPLPTGWTLIDWDQTCIGPRELDLVSGLQDHFHTPEQQRMRLFSAYGYDLTSWPRWPLLRDLTELHALASYIRLAPTKPSAAEELQRRVRSLRSGDRSVVWQAIA
jgi:hypothetical protein